jgi:hypothetical protein
MPAVARDVQHLSGPQYCMPAGSNRESRKAFGVKNVEVELGIVTERALARVQLRRVSCIIQSDVLATDDLCENVMIRVIVKRTNGPFRP